MSHLQVAMSACTALKPSESQGAQERDDLRRVTRYNLDKPDGGMQPVASLPGSAFNCPKPRPRQRGPRPMQPPVAAAGDVGEVLLQAIAIFPRSTKA